MFDIIPITLENLKDLEPLYSHFQKISKTEYQWPLGAVDFATLRKVFQAGVMKGYLIREFNTQSDVGFMFYNIEAYEALEIKVLYLTEQTPVKSALDTLMNRFLEDTKSLSNWDVISYPMVGPGQMRYIDYMTWYGFKPVGQAVVKFHMFDGVSIEIFKKQRYPQLPPGYRCISYDPRYEEGVIDVLTEAFADSVDALWDPRFRSREGIKEALEFVKTGGYGVFWPSCNTILLNADDHPVGVCLLNLISTEEANIPLIGLLQSERKHKLGRTLLAQTVEKCIDEVLKGKMSITTISATVATANIPAIKMYRHTAFQEDHWYPHVYQNQSDVMTRKPGQWC